MLELLISLLFSMFIVFVAAMLFVNAMEYLGCNFQLGGSFVGAILSPLFTSLPEMIVFLVAVFFAGVEAGEAIGIGTIFGQPFMASSLSYGLVGLTALIGYYLKKRNDLVLKAEKDLAIPYVFVTILFPLTLLPSLVGYNFVFGTLFLTVYVYYVYLMYKRRRSIVIEEAEEPIVCKLVPHPVYGSMLQLIAAVLLLYKGSHDMVGSVDLLAKQIGISAMGLALIIVPAATAIPETSTAIIWGFRGKDTLCIGSLVGEKVLYSTFYPGIALFVTSWKLDIHAYMSVVATTLVSLLLLYYIFKERIPWYGLCLGMFFFIGYTVLVFVYHV
ncbi:MAG: sodium:calcium antiporter [Archaeoglobaceae archaeon]|nr:sodium:calcium antiporter [Archaeoglobaceae archaeon]